MSFKRFARSGRVLSVIGIVSFCSLLHLTAFAGDLEEIRQRGVLRHLGIPYADFVRETASGEEDGLDVEMIQLFAKSLGVRYQWVKTSWSEAFGDLTGVGIRPQGDEVVVLEKTEVKGDLLANGLTILPWRQKVVEFSTPTFPTGVWLIARADSPLKPIEPSGDMETDIKRVRAQLEGRTVLTMKNTCLDPELYALETTGAKIRFHTDSENLNDIAPAIIEGVAEATLLDVPDALVALRKWPGEIKVIGPVSAAQTMGVAFAKTSPELRKAFNDFLRARWEDGTYEKLIRKYYPAIFLYLGEFFTAGPHQ